MNVFATSLCQINNCEYGPMNRVRLQQSSNRTINPHPDNRLGTFATMYTPCSVNASNFCVSDDLLSSSLIPLSEPYPRFTHFLTTLPRISSLCGTCVRRTPPPQLRHQTTAVSQVPEPAPDQWDPDPERGNLPQEPELCPPDASDEPRRYQKR